MEASLNAVEPIPQESPEQGNTETGDDKNARTREYRTKNNVLLIEPSYDLTHGWPFHFSRSQGNRERGSPALSQGATPFTTD
jgi:hypothetical protein